MIFGRKPSTPLAQQQAILHSIRIQTSAFGQVMPVLYGQNRLPGILLDYQDFTPIPQTSPAASGGKGGGASASTQSTTYTYTAAVDIAIAEGMLQSLRNVYDSKGKLTLLSTSVAYTIPGGGGSVTPTPPSGGVYYDDDGAGYDSAYSVGVNDYGSDGPRTLAGTQRIRFQKSSSAPTAGQYQASAGTYTFAAADAGKVATINYVYSIPNTSNNGQPATQLSLTFFPGSRPGAAWGYMSSAHPDRALAYSGIARVAASAMDLGSGGNLPNYQYEVVGLFPFGAGINDANPKDIITDAITSPFHGTLLPSTYLGDLTSYSNYCVANGIFLSPVMDSQQAGRDFVQQILDLTNSGAVQSEGLIKIIPYGDQSAVGNGATYTPDTTPQYDLTDSDFIRSGNEDPVTATVAGPETLTNVVQLEISNRANAYNFEPVEDKDEASIQIDGLRPAQIITAHSVCDTGTAAKIAMAINRRNVHIRVSYTFKIGIKYIRLEPMNLVTITDSVLGLNKFPVRVTQIEEDEQGFLTVQAEEFPWGTATATQYPKQGSSSFSTQTQADPGSVNTPIIFEASNRLSQFNGYEIYLAVSGVNLANWGGCTVHVSPDGTAYKEVGKIYGPSRMGVTAVATLPATADPDTTDTLSVDLTMSGGVLSSGSASDADNFRTLCYVDGELISYQTATLTAPNKYNLTTRLRRGVYGTTLASHAIGSAFARIDDAIFVFQYDPQWIGKTIFIKLTSFNTFGQAEQAESGVTAYSFTIAGLNKGAFANDTGAMLVGTAATPVSAIDSGASRANTAIDGSNIVVAAGVDFTRSYVNKNMDNIPDGSTNGGIGIARRNAATDASGNLLLKNIGTVQGTTSNPTTSSSSFSVIPEMTQTITTKGNKVIILFAGGFQISTGTGNVAIFRDGVQISVTISGTGAATSPYSSELHVIDAPSAASHTYDVRWFTNGGGTITALGTNRTLQVVELG